MVVSCFEKKKSDKLDGNYHRIKLVKYFQFILLL